MILNMIHTPESVKLQLTVPEELSHSRLDQAVAKLCPAYSRARVQDWIKSGQLTVNGTAKKPRDKVKGGDRIFIQARIEAAVSYEPQCIDLNIIDEDESILILDKPAGLVVHPAAGNRDQTLLNALLHYHPPLEKLPRAGIVHRLDKDTSGIMVVAKTLPAHTSLVSQLQRRSVSREYEAIVNGILTAGGSVDAPIGRHATQRTRMAVITSGKSAMTHYRVVEKFRAHTHIRVRLETGRTHQIRVHMAYIHHPLVGDKTYGGRLLIPKAASDSCISLLQHFPRQALHAQRLVFIHPQTETACAWEAPLPEDMRRLIQGLQEDYALNAGKHSA